MRPNGKYDLLGVTLAVVLAVAALTAGLWTWTLITASDKGQSPPETVSASVIADPRPLSPFSLTDHLNNEFSLDRLKGHWTFLFFGYTSCPDVCPTTLSLLSQVHTALGAGNNREKVQYAFVSVDPERDNLERLKDYVSNFNPDFIGATGPKANLDRFTRQLGVLYIQVKNPNTALGYLMDHTASIFLVDPSTSIHAVFSIPHQPNSIVEDFRRILKTYTHS